MNVHQLRTFVAVLSEGTITRAAKARHLSQPAVSAHIKALEDRVGTPLFVRAAHGMEPTSAAVALEADARAVLDAMDAFIRAAARQGTPDAGRVRLAVDANADPACLAAFLDATGRSVQHAALDIVLQHGDSTTVQRALVAGTADLGIFNARTPERRITARPIAPLALYLAVPPALEVARPQTPAAWAALLAHAWVGPRAATCCAHAAEALFAKHGVRPTKRIEVVREADTRALVAAGAGIGLLHEGTALAAERAGEVRLLGQVHRRAHVFLGQAARRADEPLLRGLFALLPAYAVPEGEAS